MPKQTIKKKKEIKTGAQEKRRIEKKRGIEIPARTKARPTVIPKETPTTAGPLEVRRTAGAEGKPSPESGFFKEIDGKRVPFESEIETVGATGEAIKQKLTAKEFFEQQQDVTQTDVEATQLKSPILQAQERMNFLDKVGEIYNTIDTAGGLIPELPEGTKMGTLPIGPGRITKTAFQGINSVFRQRGMVGKPANAGVDKIFHAVRPVAKRYANNAKSSALTKRFLVGLGGTVTAAFFIKDMIGTYPFAGFIQEEALQTLGFATRTASEAGDFEGEARAIALQEEILDPNLWEKIIRWVPYANIQKELQAFNQAARIKMENDKSSLALRKAQQEGLVETSSDVFFRESEEAKQALKGGT